MEVARRLYLYVISAITLSMLLGALISLANIAIETILGTGSGTFLGADPVAARREQLALMLATIGVALPVWALHWVLAERAARSPSPRGDAERRSAVRALYLAGVMFILMVFLIVTANGLLGYLLTLLLGGDTGDRLGPAQAVGALLIGGGFWAYHANVTAHDARRLVSNAAAWLPRLYRYLTAFIGLMLALYGIVQLVDLAGQTLAQAGGGVIGSGPRPSALAGALTPVILGFLVWAGHWWWSNRIARLSDERGHIERTARNRYGYLVLVIFVVAAAALNQFAFAVRDALSLGLGSTAMSTDEVARGVVGALVLGLVFGAVWWTHRRFMIVQAAQLSEAHAMGARRVDAYVVALLGLSMGGTGLAWLIGKAITVVFPGQVLTASGGGDDLELATFLGYTLVGSIAWLAAITIVSRWRARLALSEASSTARRTYLLLAIAGALLGGVSALVLLLNRLFGSILGVTGPRNLAAELATPIGVLVMAAVIAGLHFRWLRLDQQEVAVERTRVLQEEMASAQAPAAPVTADVAATPVVLSQTHLVLTGPGDRDVNAALDGLRRALPDGYRLEEAD